MSPKAKRRWLRRLIGATAGLLVVLIAGTVVARVFFNGPQLARFIAQRLNARINGRIEIESIDWSLDQLPTLVAGGYVKVEITNLNVLDSDGKTVLLHTDKAIAEVDAHAAIFGRHDIIIRTLTIPGDANAAATIRQVLEPYPVHEFDHYNISLITAFYPKVTPGFRAGIAAIPAPIFEVKQVTVERAALTFDYPYASWKATVADAHVATGSMQFDGTDPLARKLTYALTPRAPSGHFQFDRGQFHLGVELTDIEMQQLRQEPPIPGEPPTEGKLEYQATGRSTDGANLAVHGILRHQFGDLFGGEHDVTFTIDHAGTLAERLSQGRAAGDHLAASFTMAGPMMGPRYSLRIAGLELAVPVGQSAPLALAVDHLAASWDDATDSGTLEDTVARGEGGEVKLSAHFNKQPLLGELHVDVSRPIAVGRFLPATVRRLVGDDLAGRFDAVGSLDSQRLTFKRLRLGGAVAAGELVRTREGLILPSKDFRVTIGETSLADFRGDVDGRSGRLDRLGFAVESRDLARWLRRLDLPALASSVRGAVRLDGQGRAITAHAELAAGGLPVVDRATATIDYGHGEVAVSQLESSLLGGWLTGTGRVAVGGHPRLQAAEVTGVNLRLDQVPGIGPLLGGRVDLHGQAAGPFDRLSGQAEAKLKGVRIAGDDYADTEVVAKADGDGTKSVSFGLARKAGGELSLEAIFGRHGELGGVIDLRKLPLESIAALTGVRPLLGGRVDAALTLSGTASRPTADGTITVVRSWFKEAFLGSAALEIERTGDGLVHLRGRMFQGKVDVDGTIATAAPFQADLALKLHRAELDLFLPELAEQFGARGWLTGEVHLHGSLALAGSHPLALEAQLSEAVVVMDSEDASGRPTQVRYENATPIELGFDGARLVLRHEITLRVPTGEFAVSGAVGRGGYDLRARGTIAVDLLQPYLRRYFDHMEGALKLELAVSGPLAAPQLSGLCEVDKVALRPAGQDAIVRIPAGKIELKADQLSVTGLSMVVDDEYSDERSELRLAGGIKLAGFHPVRWALRVDGQLAGKMLLVLAPQVFSSGTGSAELSLSLIGEGRVPSIDGTLELSAKTPLTLTPRGVRREIALTGGSVAFTDQLIQLDGVSGTVDDEGKIVDVTGEIGLADWRPVDFDLTLEAEDLPFRVPQQLELALHLHQLRVVGGVGSGLDVSGTVEIVDGRYVREFNIFNEVIKPVRSAEKTTPFWKSVPLLADAQLHLQVVSRAFFVQNNLANIELDGDVTVTGTPVRPRFAGQIRVDSGSFSLTGVRARFDRTQGTINFEPLHAFPDDTPTMDITSESDFTDTSGKAYLITLRIAGSLSNLLFDLTTDSGLNRAQTLQLILTGRKPEDLRSAFGDDPVGASPGKQFSDPTLGTSTTAAYTDQVVKDLAGDLLSLATEDTLKKLTKADVARIEPTTSSIGAHFEWRLLPEFKAVFDYNQSVRGSLIGARGEWRFYDSISLDGEVQSTTSTDATEEIPTQEKAAVNWRKVLLP